MNKILNWTFGSVFRTIGRIFAYLLIGSLFALIMSKSGLKITYLLGIDTINASTLSYDYSKFYVSGVDALGQNQNWTSAMNFGDYYRYEEQVDPYLKSIRVRFGVNNNFQANTTYLVRINTIWGQSGNGSLYQQAKSVICQGSRTSTWSSDENIVSCEYIGRTLYNDNNNAGYYFKITPSVNVYGIQIAWYYRTPPNEVRLYLPNIQNIRVLSSSKIEYDNSTSDSINSQTTTIINNNNKNTEDIINSNNENTQNIINSSLVCKNVDITSASLNGYLSYQGEFIEQTGYNKSTDFIELNGSLIKLISPSNNNKRVCFYKTNKDFISCKEMNQYSSGDIISVPADAFYYRLNFDVADRLPVFSICSNGNQATNNSINDLKDSMLDDNFSNNEVASELNFETDENSFGPFATFLTLPLTWVQNILASSQTCNTINIPMPYLENKYLSLPCMTPFWNSLGGLASLISALWICVVGVRVFNGLFKLTVDITSSEGNAEELYKIKSWEL